MARSDRLLRVIQCLRTLRSPVTADVLAGELQVSQRTVYRDIEALRRSGAIIDGEAGLGYVLVEDPALPPMLFSRDEMEAIVLGLREVEQVGDPVLADAAANALSKVRACLPQRMQSEFEYSVLYAKRFVPRVKASIDFVELRQAARAEQAIEIAYRDEEGQETQRTVLPLAIVFYQSALVLLAWCQLRADFRSFRIDRISALRVTEDSFRPRRVGMLRTYLQRLEAC